MNFTKKLFSFFLSILTITFSCLEFTVLAGGEDKIERYEGIDPCGNTHVKVDLIYVSSENIHRLTQFIESEIHKQEKRKFSLSSNLIFKATDAIICCGIWYMASKLKSKNPKVACDVITAIAGISAFFTPEFVNCNAKHCLEESPHVFQAVPLSQNENEKGYGLNQLLTVLHQIDPEYWSVRRKVDTWDIFVSYPNVDDGGHGIIIDITQLEDQPYTVSFWSQSMMNYSTEKSRNGSRQWEVLRPFGRISGCDYRIPLKERLPLTFDKKLMNIFCA